MTATEIAACVRGERSQLFEHFGLFYRDIPEYVAGVTAFVRSALAAGQPVLVAVPGPNLELVRRAMGPEAGLLRLADMAAAGRNPRRIIGTVLLAFAAAHEGRRVAIVGEPIWPGRTPMEYPACLAHEALINEVFEGRDASILCPYDASGLDDAALVDATRTHPWLTDGASTWASHSYCQPLETVAAANLPLPAPPAYATEISYHDQHDLAAVRRFVAHRGLAGGLTSDQIADLTLAVNEITANTVEHTTGSGRLTVWREDGAFICQVDDDGRLTDPLAGYLPTSIDAHRGRGLALVNQLCDLVRLHTRPDGTTIRVQVAMPDGGGRTVEFTHGRAVAG